MPTATAAELQTLLEIQEHDTALDRLARRRDELPERADLAARETELAGVDAEIAEVQGRRDAVAAEEKRLDDEAAAVASRAQDVEASLYSGSVTSPRELQAMQADLESLRRHQRTLEDRELDAMEQRESVDGELQGLADRRSSLAADVGRLRDAIAGAEAEIDTQVADERAARGRLVGDVDAGLMADYERRRAANRGIGIARLVGQTCQACGLSIPAVEVDRFRREPPGTLCEPEDCRCIIVPT